MLLYWEHLVKTPWVKSVRSILYCWAARRSKGHCCCMNFSVKARSSDARSRTDSNHWKGSHKLPRTRFQDVASISKCSHAPEVNAVCVTYANHAGRQQKRVKPPKPSQRIRQQVPACISLVRWWARGFWPYLLCVCVRLGLHLINEGKRVLSNVSFPYRIFHISVTFKEIATMIVYRFAQQWLVAMLDQSGKRGLIRKGRKLPFRQKTSW